ncbi:phosphatase PAP2 family protein [Lacticaseibacillus jixiensis]|uniref:phosphatase PAP2 family protein n=1 Tax=Lacticaseibacillus jixiensis TaxID=3231926 RepID=UPI0036F20E6B
MSRRNLPLFIAIIAGLACAPFVWGVAEDASWVHQFDQAIVQVVTAWRPAWLSTVMLTVTNFGDPLSVVFLAAALAFAIGWTHRYRQAAYCIYTIAGLSACNNLLKHWLRRPRPFIADPSITPLTHAAGYSFPSGHSSGAMLLYGSIILLCGLWPWPARAKALVRTLCIIMIASIGYSRIYVQVHYPSDVAAGFLSALCGLCLLWWLIAPSLKQEETALPH